VTDFFHEEFLALELQERLRSLECHVPYDMACEQVQNFVAADAKKSDLSVEEYLAAHADEDLVAQWVEKVMHLAKYMSDEIENEYPLLAMPLSDAGNLIAMMSETLQTIEGVPGSANITGAALQVIAALGKQVALPELPSDLCLLTQVETFALGVAVRSLMELPPDVMCEPHMEWVASCAELMDSCFKSIAEQQSSGEDLSAPERRLFVVSMTDEPSEGL
jgi:hypothetical protein